MTPDLAAVDAMGQADLVRRGELTAVELVESALQRVAAVDPELGAVVALDADRALEDARHEPSGPFGGVPYLVKDLAAEVGGGAFTEGSRFLHGLVSTIDSELVRRLRAAGFVILGRTNTPEFGMAPACEPVRHGPTRNPWDPSLSTSGSSGGSAAAVASGMVPAAHGNDLGGSIRFPASACGLFGLKPTRARVPLGPEYGDVLNGWACEHALTRTVRDSAAILDATAGPMPGDPYPAPALTRSFLDEVGVDPGRLRLAYSSRMPNGELGHPDCLAALEDSVGLLQTLGHEVVEADLPGLTPQVGEAISTAFAAATSWILRYWIRRLGHEPGPFEIEPLTRAYWEAGERVTAGEYLLAVGDLQRFARVVAGFLSGYDGWLTPTMSTPPVPIGHITSTPEQPLLAAERGGATVQYPLVVANITGNPAMSLPLWWNPQGLPIGVHVLGRFGDEATLLRLAAQLEQARPWAHRVPKVTARRTG